MMRKTTNADKSLPALCPLFFLLFACAAAGGCVDEKSSPARGRTEAQSPAVQTMQTTRNENIHNAFRLGLKDIEALAGGLPEDCRQAIGAQPKEFLEAMDSLIREAGGPGAFQNPDGLLALADKNHPLPEGWEPGDLVNLKDYPSLRLSRNNLRLRAALMPDLQAMNEAAKAAGVSLLLSSTYRSAAYQKTVYERNVREMGQAAADRESSRPGRSQHQLGTVIDFGSIDDNFTGTKMERWLAANAEKFGFSLSFPDGYEEITGYRYESWHYRYIGRAAAQICRVFFGGIQQIMLEFLHNHGKVFAAAYTR